MPRESRRAKTLRYLREARELLSRRGAWIQGSYRSQDNSCFCAMGALNRAATGRAAADWNPDPSHAAAIELLSDQIPETRAEQNYGRASYPKDRVIEFNDMKSRRKKDVLNLFDQAIEAAEKS